MFDTSGTRHSVEKISDDLWMFNGWQDFLSAAGLIDFNTIAAQTGKEMDRNRGSVVYRLELGPRKEIFYLKLHKNYYKQTLKTLYKKIPYSLIELNAMMHYARAGLDALEPVAWGWRSHGAENISFLLIKELTGYCSLFEWLDTPESKFVKNRRAVACAVAVMLGRMHGYGLAHVDLFSWHIFIKKQDNIYKAHPIDLERTRVKGKLPWASWLIRRKQANDLAVLHLTLPWPEISFPERMRMYHEYCRIMGIAPKDRSFLKLVLATARHRGRKGKFQRYGVAARLRDK
jgi:hypothetical protein